VTQTGNDNILNQFEQYLSQIALSPKTITNYLADLRVFVRWAERTYDQNFSLQHVSPDQIRAYREEMIRLKRASSTINRHLQALRKCCNYLAQTNLAPANAATEIPLVRVTTGKKGKRILTAEQVSQLIKAAKNTRPSIAKRDVAIVHLLVNAGLRVTEVVDLRMDDVQFDFPGVHLSVRDARGYGIRDIPLPDEVCTVLKEWLVIRAKSAPYENVFLSQEGRPISARTVQRIVHRCATEMGHVRITPQTLRRTYAYNLYHQTDDVELVQHRLGHLSPGVTLQYLGIKEVGGRQQEVGSKK